MHFGDIEVLFINSGTFGLDGGAMFGVVPKVMWELKSPPDERNRIRMRANSLLVRAHGKNILVETGNGPKMNAKQRYIYGLEDGDPLSKALGQLGVKPEQIDLVINTHLHFDHCGGNTRVAGDRIRPVFPRARYVVQRGELEHAMSPTERDRASYFLENIEPISKEGLWDFVEGDTEILPGISVALIPGHTAHIQALMIAGGGKTVVFLSDLFPTQHHLPLPWIMGYDLYPLQTLETKRLWIRHAIAGEWIMVFGHDPDIHAATLFEHNGKIEFSPVDLNR